MVHKDWRSSAHISSYFWKNKFSTCFFEHSSAVHVNFDLVRSHPDTLIFEVIQIEQVDVAYTNIDPKLKFLQNVHKDVLSTSIIYIMS